MNELWVEKKKHNNTKFICIHLQTVTTTTKTYYNKLKSVWGECGRKQNGHNNNNNSKKQNHFTMKNNDNQVKVAAVHKMYARNKSVPLPWQVPETTERSAMPMKNRFRAIDRNSPEMFFFIIFCFVLFYFRFSSVRFVLNLE